MPKKQALKNKKPAKMASAPKAKAVVKAPKAAKPLKAMPAKKQAAPKKLKVEAKVKTPPAAKTAKPAKPTTPPKQIEMKKGKAPAAAPAAKVAAPKAAEKADPKAKKAAGKTKGRSGPPLCREVACDLVATTKTYCRLHYIKNWKRMQQKEQILKEKKLNLYIEELIAKYPDKYIDTIRQDLHSEKDFAKVIADLEIEEDVDDFIDAENEAVETVVEPVRHGTGFDDDDDTF